ncbi:DUF397 domain-containing protein [Phytohabitans aurantiacus]|uniref:DUF397 domain-containing protein n=1 Tax=Phytohabitans aurantiacus TaxID=3016789 RepID=UPI00389B200C
MTSPWIRSTRCDNAHCAEVQIGPNEVLMRNNSDLDQGVLAVGPDGWRDFTQAIRRGEFDR